MEKSDRQRLHIHLTGRVQGVGFRYFVQRNALEEGVSGWVRNRWSGGVEVVAEGPRTRLNALLQALRRGPPGSRIETLDPQWSEPTGEFTDFRVRRTA